MKYPTLEIIRNMDSARLLQKALPATHLLFCLFINSAIAGLQQHMGSDR